MSKKNLTLEESVRKKARFIRSALTSFEMRVTLALLAVAILSIIFVLFTQGYRVRVEPTGKLVPPFTVNVFLDVTKLKQYKLLNARCVELGNKMNQYFSDPTLSCDCYYELNSTGNPKLDRETKPLCTCTCTNDTTKTVIGIRS